LDLSLTFSSKCKWLYF